MGYHDEILTDEERDLILMKKMLYEHYQKMDKLAEKEQGMTSEEKKRRTQKREAREAAKVIAKERREREELKKWYAEHKHAVDVYDNMDIYTDFINSEGLMSIYDRDHISDMKVDYEYPYLDTEMVEKEEPKNPPERTFGIDPEELMERILLKEWYEEYKHVIGDSSIIPPNPWKREV